MRRVSIHRAYAKVRGVGRRLKALEQWAQSADTWNPEVSEHEEFWHRRIPVLDRLVDPPTTTPQIQRQAIKSLLLAAQKLSDQLKDRPECRVAVLLTLPDLFQSEITVFFDQDYYKTFYYQQDLLPDSQKPSQRFGFELPPGFVELGNLVEWQTETEDGETIQCREEWWTLGQAL